MEPNDGEAGAPAPKRPSRVWLMIMGAAAFGGVKFCAKRAPKLADNAAREVRHADEVLDGVRPYLSVAGGQVVIVDLAGATRIQPVLNLAKSG